MNHFSSANVQRITFSIVDGDSRTRAMVSELAQTSPILNCISQHIGARDALLAMPRVLPDVALIEINLSDMNGIECVRRLKWRLPKTQFIMFTTSQNTADIVKAMVAGATGYLLKPMSPNELIASLQSAQSGGSPMSGTVARQIVRLFQCPMAPGVLQILSPQQACVFELLSQGYHYQDIADRLGITYATVHTHIRNIYKKLQVNSRTEAVAKGLRESIAIENSQSFNLIKAGRHDFSPSPAQSMMA